MTAQFREISDRYILVARLKSMWLTIECIVRTVYKFDCTDLDRFWNKTQLEESRLKITKLIHNEVRENLGGDYSKLMIGGFSQGAALALYIASKLTPDKSTKSRDGPIRKNEKESKWETKVKFEYQSKFEASFLRSKFDNKSSEMKVNYQLNGTFYIKQKIKNEGDNIEETKKSDHNLGAVIFCRGFLLFKNPSTEIFKINKFPIFVYHGAHDEIIKWEDTVEPFLEYFDDNNNVFVYTEKIEHKMDRKVWMLIKKFLKHITLVCKNGICAKKNNWKNTCC